MTKRLAIATLGLVAALTTMAAGQGSGLEPLLAELRNPSARARDQRAGTAGRTGPARRRGAHRRDAGRRKRRRAERGHQRAAEPLHRAGGPASAAMGAGQRRQVGDAVGDRLRGGPAGDDARGRAGGGPDGAVRRRAAGPVGEDAAGSRLRAGHARVAGDGPDGRGDGQRRGGRSGGDAAGPGSAHAPGRGADCRPGLRARHGPHRAGQPRRRA